MHATDRGPRGPATACSPIFAHCNISYDSVHGLIEGLALHGLAVDLGDDVVGQNASSGGGGLVNRSHDLDDPLLHRDLMPSPPNSPRVWVCISLNSFGLR